MIHPNTKQSVQRVARAHLQRMGFNKFNAPELVGQLLGVLKGEGLDDTVDEIQSKKIPQLVDTAWRNRAKRSAATHKYAADLRQLVAFVLGEVTPFVKNPSTFFKTVLADFTDYEFDEVLGLRDKWTLENLSVNATDGGIYEGGERPSFDRYSPPEYDEIEYTYPSTVEGEFFLTISLREWPRRFAKAYQSFIKDLNGFEEALEHLVRKADFAKRLGLLYAKAGEQLFNNDPHHFVEEYHEIIKDFAQDKSEAKAGRLDISWESTKGSARLQDSGYQMSGMAVVLRLTFTVEGTVEVDTAFKDDDEPTNYPGYDLYASQKAGFVPFRKENGLRDAVVERLKKKGYKPVLFASNAFYVDADKYSVNPTGMSFGKTYALQGEGIGIGDGVTINEEDPDAWADKAVAMILKARFKKNR